MSCNRIWFVCEYRHAAVAFEIFSVSSNGSEAVLLQVDSCSAVCLPSHGWIPWRSEVRIDIYIHRRTMRIYDTYEGDKLNHSVLWATGLIFSIFRKGFYGKFCIPGSLIYRVAHKNGHWTLQVKMWSYTLAHNFAKYWLTFKILSSSEHYR